MIVEIIIILFFVTLVVLLSPVTISVNSARARQEMDGFFSFGWLLFLFTYTFKERETELLFFGRRLVRLPNKKYRMKPEKLKKSGMRKKSKNRSSFGNILYLSKPMLRLFKDLIHSFRLKCLDIDITFGLKDPAYAGIINGFLHFFLGSLRKEHTIIWTVDYTKPVMEWNLKAEAAITPIQILPPIARFVAIFIKYKIPIGRN